MQVTHPFLMDGFAPSGLEQAGQRQVHQQVAQRSRIQNAGIVDCDGFGATFNIPSLVPGTALASSFNAPRRFVSFCALYASKSWNKTRRCVPVLRNGMWPASSSPDEVGARNVKKSGSLLGRQFGPAGNQGDGVAVRHFVQDADQQAQRRRRELHGLVRI